MRQKEDKLLSTNAKPLIIGGLVVILLFFGGLGAWSAFLPFSGAVIAPGTVEISQERKTVQHLEGGIVDRILVQEGDMVEKGEVLIKLKSAQVQASVSLLRGQLWAKLAEAARLRAESQLAESIDWPEELIEPENRLEVKDLKQKEKDIFQSRRQDLMGQISLIKSQIEQLKEQIAGAEEELSAQKEIITTLGEEIDAKQSLYEEDYIDKAQLLELKRRLAERRGKRGSIKQNIAQTRQKIEELKLKIVNLRNKYKENAISQLGKTQDRIFEMREQLRPRVDAQQRLKIRAPIAGEVMNMRIHSEESGVIRGGDPILDIVPKDAKLVVESRIRPDQITDVQKGQQARVQLSAFNRRTTPPVTGEVVYVSADQVNRETSSGKQSFYIAHVNIDKKELEKIGAYLSPGMPAVSYIETEKRTVLGYLLEPILEVMDKSMRES